MIRKLRYKFIAVAMTGISLLFILILCVINISMTLSSRRQGYDMLLRISEAPVMNDDPESDGFSENKKDSALYRDKRTAEGENFTEDNIEPIPFRGRDRHPNNYLDALRVFNVTYDSQGSMTRLDYNPKSDLTEDNILTMGQRALDQGKERGTVHSRYLYLKKEMADGVQLFFMDYSLERTMSFRLFYLCLASGLIGIVFLFIAVFFLSRWIVQPVQNAFDKQKQFIADASHELKTPLIIITTNAEVLSSTLGENKWLVHILDQTRRMNLLIRDLLELARLDAFEKAVDFLPFDLSRAVSAAALSFESIAYEANKTFQMHITEGLQAAGDEQSVRQLVTILLDNAFKYSDEKGTVSLSLSRKGDKKILSVRNTGKGIATDDLKHIFERFFRSDSSRSRESGGYGLGLSIAASIAQAHKGHISAKSDGETFTLITVTLP